MKNILKNIVNCKIGNSEIVEVEQLNPEEEEKGDEQDDRNDFGGKG